MNEINVRFAPSPTGFLHLGGLRTALYSYCFTKKNGGKIFLRIEDTDRSRFVKGSIENIVSVLNKMEIHFDGATTIQSQRLTIYQKYAKELVKKGAAYYCFCNKETLQNMRDNQRKNNLPIKYDKRCKNLSKEKIKDNLNKGIPYVIRLSIPEKVIFTVDDIIRGRCSFDSSQIDEQIILKSDGFPTYHLAVVVDDHLMKISHVIRGEEWLSSTPKHILLYQQFGWKVPIWAHLPLILNKDKSKLSKREGDFSVEGYLKKGYIKECLLNYVALLGWHPKGDEEVFSLKQMTECFSLSDVNKAGAVFDIKKLNWMNGVYLRNLKMDNFIELIKPYFKIKKIDISDKTKFLKVARFVKERISLLPEIIEISKVFYSDISFSQKDLKMLKNNKSKKVFSYYIKNLKEKDSLETFVQKSIEETGIRGRDYFFSLRLALYGNTSGPHIPEIIDILGYKETIKRLTFALNIRE